MHLPRHPSLYCRCLHNVLGGSREFIVMLVVACIQHVHASVIVRARPAPEVCGVVLWLEMRFDQ